MNGKIRIGTVLDNSKLDKQLLELDRRLRDKRQEIQQNKIKIGVDDKKIETATNGINKLEKLIKNEKNLEIKVKNEKKLETLRKNLDSFIEKRQVDVDVKVKNEEELNKIESQIERVQNKQLNNSLKQVNNVNPMSGSMVNRKFSPNLSLNNIYDGQAITLNRELTETSEKLDKINNKFKDVSKSLKDIDNTSKKSSLSRKFEGDMKSIKRFAMSLIGVHTIWSLVSRATSSYMSTNDKLTKQMEANWVALGTILEPIINGIVRFIKKAVTAVLYFASCLTKVDFIAKANANAIKKQTKETKELAKANDLATASFDEMSVFNPDTSANKDTTSGIDKDSLFNVDDLGSGLKKFIEEAAKFLTPFYEKIKDIIQWAKENPEAVIKILGGMAIFGFISKLLGTAGLGGVSSKLLGLIALSGTVIYLYFDALGVWEANKEILETNKNIDKTRENIHKSGLEMVEYVKNGTNDLGKRIDLWKNYSNTVRNGNNYIKENGKIESQTAATVMQMSLDRLKAMKTAYENGQLSVSQQVEYKNMIRETRESLELMNQKLYDQYGYTIDIGDSLDNLDAAYDDVSKNLESTTTKMEIFNEIAKNLGVDIDTKDFQKLRTEIGKSIDEGKPFDEMIKDFIVRIDKGEFGPLKEKIDEAGGWSTVLQGVFESFGIKIDMSQFDPYAEKVDEAKENSSWLSDVISNFKAIFGLEDFDNLNDEIDKSLEKVNPFDELLRTFKVNVDSKDLGTTKDKVLEVSKKIKDLNIPQKVKIGADLGNFKSILSTYLNGTFKTAFSSIVGSVGLSLNFPTIKLATGAIVNNPGRGVMSGNTIRGEAGKEGVLPLTNHSTMSELGREIGKYITLNATLNNYLDGRLLQRQQLQVANDVSFATNGRH